MAWIKQAAKWMLVPPAFFLALIVGVVGCAHHYFVCGGGFAGDWKFAKDIVFSGSEDLEDRP